MAMDDIDLYEFAWLTTQQVVVTSDNKANNIKAFGSGFFLQYKNNLFFVTADHVSHSDDFEKGIRLEKDDYLWVFNNINSKLSTILTPIGGLFSFDQMNTEDELSFDIPDMKDISFAMHPNSFKYPFLTHELKNNKGVIVEAGKAKIFICSECVAELSDTDYCLIEGCVKYDIKNGITLYKENVIHQGLKLERINEDGYYILKYPNPVIYEEWEGLSGGPVFNQKAQLIGMIIEVNKNDDTVKVIPINKITELMDFAIKYEMSITKTKDGKQ